MATPDDDSDKHLVTGFLRKLPNDDLSWYDLMDRMIGSKKQRFSDVMLPPVGIPQAPRLPEEIRIQRAMDSCLFKSVMSCVIGKSQDFSSLVPRVSGPKGENLYYDRWLVINTDTRYGLYWVRIRVKDNRVVSVSDRSV